MSNVKRFEIKLSILQVFMTILTFNGVCNYNDCAIQMGQTDNYLVCHYFISEEEVLTPVSKKN